MTHHSQSPYNIFDGNPVYYSDPSGADSDPPNGGDPDCPECGENVIAPAEVVADRPREKLRSTEVATKKVQFIASNSTAYDQGLPLPSYENYNKTRDILNGYPGRIAAALDASPNQSVEGLWRRAHNLDNNGRNIAWNSLLGAVGEEIVGYIAEDFFMNLAVGNGFIWHIGGFNIRTIPDDEDDTYVENSRATNDYFIEVKRRIGAGRQGINIWGYSASGKHYTADAQNYHLTVRTRFLFEVKTLSPSKPSTGYRNVLKGYRQTLRNMRAYKLKPQIGVGVLVVDKEAYKNIYDAATPYQRRKLDHYHKKLMKKGGLLWLIPELHGRATDRLTTVRNLVKNGTTNETR